ncbi:MAG: SGNH/GDSL hydrolase family protein [Deferribacteres bacterium]|nr:SGNH/GDSL hydrolase family protein [Deferribacteres bacterium]
MLKRFKKLLPALLSLTLLLVFFEGNTFAAEQNKLRVLFVGNSYTYYHSMPQMFKNLVQSQFPDTEVTAKFIGGGGATLKKHWDVGEALHEIRTAHWDYVILQGQSMFGSANLADPDSPKQFFEYARKFDREIKQSGAQTIFFMTWCRKTAPDQQRFLTGAYLEIAHDLQSKTAPVGMVWEELREQQKMELYMNDGSHPSETGSYVAALTFFSTIFDMIPNSMPGELHGYEILRGGKLSKERVRLCSLPDEQVSIILGVLQSVQR